MEFRTKDIKVSPIKQMELRASKVPGVVSLAQGIPSFDTPEIIKRRAIEAIRGGKVAKYSLTIGLPALREAVEESLAKEGMHYDFDTEIIITAGSIEGIAATFLTLLDPGDEVILFSPSYTSYQEAIKVAGGVCVFADLDEESGWTFDINSLESLITGKTKVVLLCNPNNPTGTIFKKRQIIRLAELVEKHGFYVLTDEVYKDFLYTDGEFFTPAQIPEIRKRVIRTFSFSKSHAMTGWRVAYLHTDRELAAEILKVHDAIVTCAPVVSQYAGIAALEMAGKDVEEFKKIFKKRRDLICRRLDELRNVFSYQAPDSSYFVFPKILRGEKDSWKFCLDLLENAKVVLVPGVAFGPNGEGHVRMCFGRSEEAIVEAFDRMEKYFKTR